MTLGSTFHYFRIGKGLTLAEAAGSVVSPSYLSRFERELTEITATHLFALLRRLNITVSEFANQAMQQNPEMDFERLANIFKNHDIEALQQEIQSTDNETTKQLYESMISVITETPLADDVATRLLIHLSRVETWTNFEIYLFGMALPTLPYDLLKPQLVLTGHTIVDYRPTVALKQNFNVIFTWFNNAILTALKHHDFDTGNTLLAVLLTVPLNERNYYHRIRIKNLRGTTLYCSGNHAMGIQFIKESIQAMALIGDIDNQIQQEHDYLRNILSPKDFVAVFSDTNGHTY
jgi:Rgg/GadR/MutR family transcriptional activator